MMKIVAMILAALAVVAGMYFGIDGLFRGADNLGGAAVIQVQLLRALTCFAFAGVVLLSGIMDTSAESQVTEQINERLMLILRVLQDSRKSGKL